MTIEEEITRTIDKAESSTQTGSKPHRHRVIAAALSPLLNRVRAEAIRECVNKLWVTGLDMNWLEIRAYLRDCADQIEQNGEGNEA